MNTVTDIWDVVKRLLSEDLNELAVELWFDDCKPQGLEDNSFIIYAATSLKRDTINKQYFDKLTSALRKVYGTDVTPVVRLESENKKEPSVQRSVIGNGKEKYSFENFIVGPSNRFAHAAANSVADGKTGYNPLFIYGNPGLGKTHLLYAIANKMRHTNKKMQIVYTKGEAFMNELIESIRNQRNEEFRRKFRSADLLLVDDIQFIAGKEQTQDEFFHTFEELFENGKQIVLTSDRPPKDMLRLEDRLRSRFAGGLMTDIQPPDFETRVVIVKSKASELGLELYKSNIEYIADNIKTNVRLIESVLNKMTAYKEMLNVSEAPSIEITEDITKDLIRREKSCDPELIIQRVSRHFAVSPGEIIGKSRTRSTSQARHIAMYLIRKLTDLSLDEIGGYFGKKDHSTVLHGIQRIEDGMDNDPTLSDVIRDLTSDVNENREELYNDV